MLSGVDHVVPFLGSWDFLDSFSARNFLGYFGEFQPAAEKGRQKGVWPLTFIFGHFLVTFFSSLVAFFPIGYPLLPTFQGL